MPQGRSRFAGHEYPQDVPVPDETRPGARAPWSSLAPEARSGLTLAVVEERLRVAWRHLDASPVPEDPAEMVYVGDARARSVTRRSAVLVALFEEDGEAHVVLTRRAFHLRQHRGEIALPGGRGDPGETPIDTALREAHEEVGIESYLVRPIAWLSPLVTFASGSAIWPVVGVLNARPELVIDPGEVDRAFTVPLTALLAEGAFLEERWRRLERRVGADDDGFVEIRFFAVPGDLIWGATARVLTELLCLVTGVDWPDAGRPWA